MKTYLKLIEALEQNTNQLQLQNNDIYVTSEQGVNLCREALEELKSLVCSQGFESEFDEILFYKKIKPYAVGMLIYFVENFNIESNRPNTAKKTQIKYLENYIETLQMYFNKNLEFYYYIKSGASHLDEQYFLSKNAKIRLNKESFYFLTDQQFTTSHCCTLATIMAYEKLIAKLKLEINQLQNGQIVEQQGIQLPTPSNLNWTRNKTDLIELIYAIHSTGAINNGAADIKETARAFESVFNIDLGNFYHSFVEMRLRKISPTKFVDNLKTSLTNYIMTLDT